MRYYLDLPIALQDFSCPSNGIFNALSLWLSSNPQFKVLRGIVQLVAIYVMYILTWKQVATKFLFHDIAMFKHISSTWNDYAPVSTRCKIRAFQLLNLASIFLRMTRANFSKLVELRIMRRAVTSCPQWFIAIRSFTARAFGVLRRSPKQIASLTQSTLHIGYFPSTLGGRAQSVNLFCTLKFIVATAEFCSHIRDWSIMVRLLQVTYHHGLGVFPALAGLQHYYLLIIA